MFISPENRSNVLYAEIHTPTVLEGDKKYITGLLTRERLVNIQLPQKFQRSLLLNAHRKALSEDRNFTEDTSLLFHYFGTSISILEGEDYNIKLTTNFDLLIAEEIYKEYMVDNR